MASQRAAGGAVAGENSRRWRPSRCSRRRRRQRPRRRPSRAAARASSSSADAGSAGRRPRWRCSIEDRRPIRRAWRSAPRRGRPPRPRERSSAAWATTGLPSTGWSPPPLPPLLLLRQPLPLCGRRWRRCGAQDEPDALLLVRAAFLVESGVAAQEALELVVAVAALQRRRGDEHRDADAVEEDDGDGEVHGSCRQTTRLVFVLGQKVMDAF